MNQNIAVFTTKKIVDQLEPINIVIHDEEGDWHFLSGSNVVVEDFLIVSMGEILKIDPTVKEVLNISIGKQANRSRNDKWKIKDFQEEQGKL